MSNPFYVPGISDAGSDSPLDVEIPGSNGKPTLLRQAGAGLITGVQEVPLAGFLFSEALKGSGAVSQEQLNGYARDAEAGPVGRAAELVGEWAPQLIGGQFLWNVGRKLALSAVARVGASVIGGVVEANAVKAAALAGADTVAPLLQRAMGGPLRKQLADTVLLAAGEAPTIAGSPAILRTAEILGGNSLIGSVVAADSIAKGVPFLESVRDGARAAALSGGAEAALTVGGKLLFAGARATERGLVGARARGTPAAVYTAAQVQKLKGSIAQAEAAKAKAMSEMTAFKQLSKELGADETAAAFGHDYAAAQTTHRRALVKQRAAKGALTPLTAALEERADELPLLSGVFRGHGPIGSGALGRTESAVQKAILTIGTSSRQMAKKLGQSTAQFMSAAVKAEADHAITSGGVVNDIMKVSRAARVATNTPRGLVNNNDKYLLDYVHAYQKAGQSGLRNFAISKGADAASADRLVEVWGNAIEGTGINGLIQKGHKALREVGIEPTPLGRGQIPMLLRDDLSSETLTNKLVVAFQKQGHSYEESLQSARKLVGMRIRRNSMFTGQDAITNELKGLSLKEAIEAGFPVIEDPMVALQTYLTGLHKRVAYAKHLGPHFEVAKVLEQAAIREGASEGLVKAVHDGTLMRNYGDQGARAVASAVSNLQAAVRMTFSVIPNASQSVLTATTHGALNTLRFLMPGGRARTLLASGRRYEDEVVAAGLNNSILSGYRETYLDPNSRSPLGWLADAVFTGTQFNRMEGWNRKTAAATGLYDTLRTMTMMAEGRLKGQTLITAARKLESVGIRVQVANKALKTAIAKAGGDVDQGLANFLNESDGSFLKRVAWRATQNTQFLPSGSNKPTFWHSPVGRVMFQFKSFALGQANLMRDTVLAEAAHGNTEPLVRLLVLAPPAGEAVRQLQSYTRDPKSNRRMRPEDGIERLLADVTAIGGFGVVSDIAMAARNSRLLGFAMGPTATDVTRFFEAVASDHVNDRLAKQVQQLPAYRASFGIMNTQLGKLGAKHVRDFREFLGSQGEPDFQQEVDAPTLTDYGRTQ